MPALTEKNRKLAWIGAGLVAIYFAGPWLMNTAHYVFAGSTAPPAKKPSPIHTTPQVEVPKATRSPSFDPEIVSMIGSYGGAGLVPGLGFCQVALQIKRNADKSDEFTGYSSTRCNPSLALTGKVASRENMARDTLAAMSPTSVVARGEVKNGAIHFSVTNNIGVPADNCPISELTATPFASGEIALQWQATEQCMPGQMILRKL